MATIFKPHHLIRMRRPGESDWWSRGFAVREWGMDGDRATLTIEAIGQLDERGPVEMRNDHGHFASGVITGTRFDARVGNLGRSYLTVALDEFNFGESE